MMRRRHSVIAYLIFGLAAIGILSKLLASPSTMLIPLLVLGGVFLLYKFPPRGVRFRGTRPGRRTDVHRSKASRKAAFRVIRGNKRDDDEPPRYH